MRDTCNVHNLLPSRAWSKLKRDTEVTRWVTLALARVEQAFADGTNAIMPALALARVEQAPDRNQIRVFPALALARVEQALRVLCIAPRLHRHLTHA